MAELILWNNDSYAEALEELFGSENVVTDQQSLQAALRNWQEYHVLIVLCELNWTIGPTAVNMQDLYGIELVKEFRRADQITLPVLFVSFLPLPDIFNAEREIVTAIGHRFQQLPAAPEAFKTVTGAVLSEMELADIQSFYCSKEGILAHELHYLNNYLNYQITTQNQSVVFEDFIRVIQKINHLFFADPAADLLNFRLNFSVLSKENITEAVEKVKQYADMLSKLYGVKTSKDLPIHHSEEYNWKVLLLDDQIGEDHELVKLMRANHIKVICTASAPTAAAILQADWETENNIMVVIADYRLYEFKGGIRYHQTVQGYQFLKSIAATDHLVRLVAFSGLQRKFLFNSFSNYNIRTEVKSKNDYLASNHTMQLFCEEIIQMARENSAAIEAMPSKCAGFEKYLKDAYIAFRMHPSYRKWEEDVAYTAKAYVQELQAQLKEGAVLRTGAIDHIKSPLAKTKKDTEAYFTRFQHYLVARRIALWLYAGNKKGVLTGIDSRRIAELLTDQRYPTDAYRQVISTNLGLSLDDFPKNITIEERRWLQYEMQLPIFRDIALIDNAFSEIARFFAEAIGEEADVQEQIRQSGFQLNMKYKNAIYAIDFDTSFTPVLRTATDVRVMYILLEKYLTGK